MKDETILFVNFGGPRDLDEVFPFLEELLGDQELLRTPLPSFLHRPLFSYVAKKRSQRVKKDYEEIGGKSMIYFDTEYLAKKAADLLQKKTIVFHRYLPSTHRSSLEAIEKSSAEKIYVFPFFPQFSTATTGSIATFFAKHLSKKSLDKLIWLRSYPDHPSFVLCYKRRIEKLMQDNLLEEEKTFLLFSAHGVPLSFIEKGDSYQKECIASFEKIASFFPRAQKKLSYQSKFGPGKWLTPSTEEISSTLSVENTQNCIIIPLSFTSDHIETLFEIEKLYVPLLKKKFSKVVRCPSLNQDDDWLLAIIDLIQNLMENSKITIASSYDLLRKKSLKLKLRNQGF